MSCSIVFFLSVLLLKVASHDGMTVNPILGVPGYPDCIQPDLRLGDVEHNAHSLQCFQKSKDYASQPAIACVGDSITAGVHSEDGLTYPAQLQTLLGSRAKVTNLGACGSTLMKSANSPYWLRPQYKTLINNTWDVVIIMLGTNDAKDAGSHGPPNWPHNCTGSAALHCPYSKAYHDLISVIQKLGPGGASPHILLAIPPPLMELDVYGMNQTVINYVLPQLVPSVAAAHGLPVIDVFDALGGRNRAQFPAKGCTVSLIKTFPYCANFCSATQKWQCDQCHPDNGGYHVMAQAVARALSNLL